MFLRRSLVLAASAAALSLPAMAGQLQQTISGQSLLLEGLWGEADIVVDPSASGFTVKIDGPDELTSLITMGTRADGTAFVYMADDTQHRYNGSEGVRATISVPTGTDLAIDGFTGNLRSGDLGDLAVDAGGSGKMEFGKVDSAALDMSGSSDVSLGDVAGRLAISKSGSGETYAGNAGDTVISMSGSGDVKLGSARGLAIDVSGSSDIEIGAVNGPTDIDLSGSGDVLIRSGTASPFRLSTSGSSSVIFNGTAVNPEIDASGSADVCIARVEGSMEVDGANVRIDPAACSRG